MNSFLALRTPFPHIFLHKAQLFVLEQATEKWSCWSKRRWAGALHALVGIKEFDSHHNVSRNFLDTLELLFFESIEGHKKDQKVAYTFYREPSVLHGHVWYPGNKRPPQLFLTGCKFGTRRCSRPPYPPLSWTCRNYGQIVASGLSSLPFPGSNIFW